ncbi:MAG: undecaprenyl-phosphate glucose phosphotransferase [Agriterribacter sp.]
MNQHLSNLIRIGFLLLDLLALNTVYYGCRFFFSNYIPVELNNQYLYLWIWCNFAWIIVSWGNNTYRNSDIFSFEKFSRNTMHAYGYFLALVTLYLFLNKQSDVSRLFFLSMLISFAFGLIVDRIIHLGLYHYFRNKAYITRKVVIIGYNTRAKKLAEYLEQQPIYTEILGFCEDETNIHELTHYPIISDRRNIINYSLKEQVTEIFSTISPEEDKYIYTLMNQADHACIKFRILPDLDHFIRRPVHIEYIDDMPVLSPRHEPLDDVGNRIKKRFFDIVVSSIAIIFILSWLVPILAILIKLESRGPVFFVQKRNGKDGRPFNCLKFRSMTVNRDSDSRQATKNDSRITKMGAFMRKTSLDELPQFFNVLMSDMSVVGPRPHMLKHTEEYSRLINQFMIRHFLKPGITGWAQVNGLRGETKTTEDMANRVKYDIWYLENWSLWFDTRIVFMTVFNVMKGEKNAY